VGAGTALYELEPLDAAGFESAEPAAAAGSGLVLCAEQSGRFYHRPTPGDPPFVAPGGAVTDGTPVGLLEVMKTFTQVPYRARGGLPADARVVRMLTEDGADVEVGQPLLEVEARAAR
jgi:acetyl-CoA carboxylase biotin carboxyl carrier protein